MKSKEPHQHLTVQDNQMTKTQEVLYQKEFKKADAATKKNNNQYTDKKFLN
ncbi:YfhE family protein [Lysinibacillus sp. BW-2-10]|uniref:YfhE family protein n=1 Tax=Lysinibacillus antri TaxID=2498145 RepID=A0A3S0QP84_9BACI|nr:MULTISPECIES: YfhE family protein [Lysinibacillus]RUL51281.1 YfhE family protein [Lysinibacillus antri]TSI05148.1 YfhE family protein [Lysinibacillus sp. BW-2-10]